MWGNKESFALLVVLCATGLAAEKALAQTFGAELHNTMMPASGAMAGVSVARPQDLPSALGGNPATLAQFKGTNFTLGGGWAEPTITMDNAATLPLAGVSPYTDKSGRPGSTVGNIAVGQDLSALGFPVTLGVGLLTVSGLGVDYRATPESNATSAELQGLGFGGGAGVQLTDQLSMGATIILGASTMDGPFSGIGAAVPAYALRASLGAGYQVTDCTDVGLFWLTRQSFQFDDAVLLPLPGGNFAPAQYVELDLPETFGVGIANDRLFSGRLLLAADVLYKRYSEADFFRAVWEDQFILQLGAQYQLSPKIRLRLGYAYAEDIMRDLTPLVVGGVIPPDGLPAVKYIQAQFPAINEHRFTGGVGVRDVLPGVDLDLYAGGMLDATDQLGATAVSAESYWIGLGLTWRFQRGACESLSAPDRW